MIKIYRLLNIDAPKGNNNFCRVVSTIKDDTSFLFHSPKTVVECKIRREWENILFYYLLRKNITHIKICYNLHNLLFKRFPDKMLGTYSKEILQLNFLLLPILPGDTVD